MAVEETAISASNLLQRAREARAVWHGFPGFTSDLEIRTGEKRQAGRVVVSAGGDVTLEGFAEPMEGVRQTIGSLVSHRLSGDGATPASFPDQNADHPLGRLVKLDDDAQMGSTYRILGDEIRQVNRTSAGQSFSISVLDVARNPEGKYLPSVYTVTFWDADGSLRSVITVREEYARVGPFDLPKSRLSVASGRKAEYSELTFSNWKLAPAK